MTISTTNHWHYWHYSFWLIVKSVQENIFSDDCSIMAQLLILSSKYLKKISVQNIFRQTFFADDLLRKLKLPQDLRVPYTDYENMRLKGFYKLIDWETPQRLRLRLRWGPQIADICFWLLENDCCSLTMLIASSHIYLISSWKPWSSGFRVTCIDLTNFLSDHLFRCLNSNHSRSLIVIKHMLFQFPKGKGDQI